MRRLFSVTLVLVLGAALGVVPLASRAADPSTSSGQAPFEINAVLATTGAAGFAGKAESQGLAVEETVINNAGGINGRPVKFVIWDDQSNPQVAVQIGNQLLAKGVPVVIGPSLLPSCAALQPIFKGKAVVFCTSAGYHPDPNSFAFTQGVSTIDQLVFAVRYLRLSGIRKIAAVTSVDANGMDVEKGLELALSQPENKDMSLVTTEHFSVGSIGDVTVDAQMSKVKASGAQAVINYNTGTPFGTVLHGYTNVGLDIPLVTQPAALSFSLMNQYASFLPKELLITGLVGDAPDVAPRGPISNAIRGYVDSMKGAGVEPDHVGALAWDIAQIIVAAYKKYGLTATGPQINDYIQTLHGWVGMNGQYDFRSSQSGLTPSSIVMVRWTPEKKAFLAVSRPGGGPITARR